MKHRFLILPLVLATGLGAVACREEGAAEKAGRKVDETIDKLQHPGEGALEKLGRKTDEAVDEAKEAVQGEEHRD